VAATGEIESLNEPLFGEQVEEAKDGGAPNAKASAFSIVQ
jgi:hypothetical protein